MRSFGRLLVGVGVIVGVATGLALLLPVNMPGVNSWLIGVAVSKLALISAVGLIAAGTVIRRAARRGSTEPGRSRTAPDARVAAGATAALPEGSPPDLPNHARAAEPHLRERGGGAA